MNENLVSIYSRLNIENIYHINWPLYNLYQCQGNLITHLDFITILQSVYNMKRIRKILATIQSIGKKINKVLLPIIWEQLNQIWCMACLTWLTATTQNWCALGKGLYNYNYIYMKVVLFPYAIKYRLYQVFIFSYDHVLNIKTYGNVFCSQESWCSALCTCCHQCIAY